MRISISLSDSPPLSLSLPQDRVACGSEADPEPVPGELLDADCPYPELKLSVLQSFHALAESYQARRSSITQRLGCMDRYHTAGRPQHDPSVLGQRAGLV